MMTDGSGPRQKKQKEWHEQWSMLQDNESSLFTDWIYPLSLEELRGKSVLEAGCGGGQHTAMMARFAESITAVDLNTVELARERNKDSRNIRFVEADIAQMNLGRSFDVVISIGVVHHTDDPDATVRNLLKHVSPGGRLVLWVYSREGNSLVEYVVEPIRKLVLRHLSRPTLYLLSKAITAAMVAPVYSVYFLPLSFLPYYEYFGNFRRLSFDRNVLNVFDKLNAPQVQLISKERAQRWLRFAPFEETHLSPYRAVSWRVSARLADPSNPLLKRVGRD